MDSRRKIRCNPAEKMETAGNGLLKENQGIGSINGKNRLNR